MNLCMMLIQSGSKYTQMQNIKFFNNYLRSLILQFIRYIKIFFLNILKNRINEKNTNIY